MIKFNNTRIDLANQSEQGHVSPDRTDKSIVWQVTPLGTPAVIRNCNKCGAKRRYQASHQFRINAQGRNLDVWLIYKCERCDNTWNMAIHSRIKPESLDKTAYQAYIENEPFQASRCAFDRTILARNKADVCSDDVDYEIAGPDVDISELSEAMEITIVTAYHLDVRLSKILRQKLGLSQSSYKKLVEQGVLAAEQTIDLNKGKLKNSVKVRVNACKISPR